MPVDNCYPAWTTPENAGLDVGIARVGNLTDASDSTYILFTPGDGNAQFGVQGPSGLFRVSHIRQVDVVYRTGRAGGGGNGVDIRVNRRVSGSWLGGSTTVATTFPAVFTTGTTTIGRPGGGAFGPDDFPLTDTDNYLTIGAQLNDQGAGNDTYLVEIKCSVTWDPPNGGFSWLLTGLAGAALGLEEMAALSSHFFRRTGTLILPREYRRAWREIREAKHAAYSLGAI